MMWAYRSQPVERSWVVPQQPVLLHPADDPGSGHTSTAAIVDHSLSRPFSESGAA
jgi:hypothetical protein